MSNTLTKPSMAPARQKLLDAALAVIREKGYVATTVDELCARAGVAKGSGEPHVKKVGTITPEQIRAIAERKMPDLNANDLDAASKIIAGTARSMGVDVK